MLEGSGCIRIRIQGSSQKFLRGLIAKEFLRFCDLLTAPHLRRNPTSQTPLADLCNPNGTSKRVDHKFPTSNYVSERLSIDWSGLS